MKKVKVFVLAAIVIMASLTVASSKARKLDGGDPKPCPPVCPSPVAEKTAK